MCLYTFGEWAININAIFQIATVKVRNFVWAAGLNSQPRRKNGTITKTQIEQRPPRPSSCPRRPGCTKVGGMYTMPSENVAPSCLSALWLLSRATNPRHWRRGKNFISLPIQRGFGAKDQIPFFAWARFIFSHGSLSFYSICSIDRLSLSRPG